MLSQLLACLCCGLFLAQFWDIPPWWPILPIGLTALGLLCPFRKVVPWLICLALAAAGPFLYQWNIHPPYTTHDLRLLADGEPHRLSGRVLHSSGNSLGRQTIDLENLVLHDDEGRTALSGRLRLSVDNLPLPPLPGTRLQWRARLRLPHPFGTPGEYNYARHLAGQGIRVTGYLKGGEELVHWADQDQSSLSQILSGSRQAAASWLESSLPENQAPLARALLLGDRGGFSQQLRDRVSRTGLAHLLAISGLHLGLLAWFLYLFSLSIYRRSTRLLLWQPPAKVLPVFLILPLLTYTLFTGGALSTWRALLMYSLAALLLLRGERQRPIDLLQLALLCILLLQPLAFFEPGLQLSAAGVAGIVLLVPRWKSSIAFLPRGLQKVLEIPLATLAATLATGPLVGLYFHQLIPAGLISNLFAIPLIGFGALPVGLLGLLGHFLHLPGSEPAIRFSGWLLKTTLDLGEEVSHWPLLTPSPWYPDPWQLAAGLGLVLAIVLFSNRSWRRGLVMLSCGGLALWLPIVPGELSLTAFSVGQGEALLLTRPDGSRLLIDGGGLRNSTFDVGERLLAPALGHLGVHSLDAVIMTHPHPDHYLGLAAILKNIPVQTFYSALEPRDLPPELSTALQPTTRVQTLEPGWHRLPGPTQAPTRVWVPRQQGKATNDHSIALYQSFGIDGVLLTGDLEKDGINQLLSQFPDRQVTLLKLPHHGSRHSPQEKLLRRFHPRAALVSAGLNNSYRLPSADVVELCQRMQVPLLRTDLQQTIRCRSCGQGWTFAFWHNSRYQASPVTSPAQRSTGGMRGEGPASPLDFLIRVLKKSF